jgi:hypothetical protein
MVRGQELLLWVGAKDRIGVGVDRHARSERDRTRCRRRSPHTNSSHRSIELSCPGHPRERHRLSGGSRGSPPSRSPASRSIRAPVEFVVEMI